MLINLRKKKKIVLENYVKLLISSLNQDPLISWGRGEGDETTHLWQKQKNPLVLFGFPDFLFFCLRNDLMAGSCIPDLQPFTFLSFGETPIC